MTDEEYRRKYSIWTPKGVEAYESTRRYLMTLFGGAKGGSKTVTGCRIIQNDISNYRGGLFVVMRKNYTSLQTTTKKSFERFFPPELILRPTKNTWYCDNDNEILWWAADRTTDPDYEKTRGLEATAIFLDEASQFDQEFYEILPSLLRRPAFHVDDGHALPGYIYMTTNPVPGKNFLKRHFIDPKTRKQDGQHHFIQSLPDDNPLLPAGYIERAFSNMSGPVLEMLRYGNWDIEESDFKIVVPADLQAVTIDRVINRNPKSAGIDVGLGAPDPTVVWCANEQGEVWRELAIREYDTEIQCDLISPIIERVKANGGKAAIDAGSVGKGLSDKLFRKFGQTIIPVLFGESPEEEIAVQGKSGHQYENRRAQIYFWLRLDIAAAARAIERQETPAIRIEEHDHLQEDLENTYYMPDVASGKIKLEPKLQIKERLGRSPDDADGLALLNVARRRTLRMKLNLPTRTADRSAPRRRSGVDMTGY